MAIESGSHMTKKNLILKIALLSLKIRRADFQKALFFAFFSQNLIFFSITIGGYIAMKSTGFFYKKNLCCSYVLFIFNNRNNKIPLKLSIRVAFMHT